MFHLVGAAINHCMLRQGVPLLLKLKPATDGTANDGLHGFVKEQILQWPRHDSLITSFRLVGLTPQVNPLPTPDLIYSDSRITPPATGFELSDRNVMRALIGSLRQWMHLRPDNVPACDGTCRAGDGRPAMMPRTPYRRMRSAWRRFDESARSAE
jgi:hypothetical protein